MTSDWQIDEGEKTITYKKSGVKFKWHSTVSGLALAPFSPAANDKSYVLQLKEAQNILKQHLDKLKS